MPIVRQKMLPCLALSVNISDPVRSLRLFLPHVTQGILEGGSSKGTAFPSSHVAVVVAQALMALLYQRWTGWAIALLSGGLAMGAVYGGFHYAVDIVAGAGVGVAAYAIALAIPIDVSRGLDGVAGGRS